MRVVVLSYNFVDGLISRRCRELFKNSDHDVQIFYRKGNNLIDMFRFSFFALKNYDILYCASTGIPSTIASIIAKVTSFNKKKVFVDTGDLVYLFTKAEGKTNRIALELIDFFENIHLNIADRIIVRAPYHKTYLQNKYSGIEDVQYLPDGVDMQQFRPVDASVLREELGLKDYFVIGVMGNLMWIKDWEWCYGWYEIQAMMELRGLPIKLLVVGSGEGKNKMEQYVFDNDLHDSVIRTGEVPHEKLNDYLNVMDVFCFTQPHHEQTRIRTCSKLPEILAAGNYVIATDLDEPKKWIKENGRIVKFDGLKDPTYPTRLAKVLREIAHNSNIKLLGKKGVSIAEKNFVYTVLRKKLKIILEMKTK